MAVWMILELLGLYINGEVLAPRVEVYSLRTHTWKKLEDPVVPRFGMQEGTYVDGSFYWLEKNVKELGKDLWILSFDFENEEFKEIKVAKQVSNCIVGASLFRLMEYEGSLALCVIEALSSSKEVGHLHCIWLMRQENGVISWILRFRAALKNAWPLGITRRGTILLEMHHLSGLPECRGILACNLKTMHHNDLRFHMHVSANDPLLFLGSLTVDTSSIESLVMYEGGKSLLKFAS